MCVWDRNLHLSSLAPHEICLYSQVIRRQEWTAIIPNSQLIVIPFPHNNPRRYVNAHPPNWALDSRTRWNVPGRSKVLLFLGFLAIYSVMVLMCVAMDTAQAFTHLIWYLLIIFWSWCYFSEMHAASPWCFRRKQCPVSKHNHNAACVLMLSWCCSHVVIKPQEELQMAARLRQTHTRIFPPPSRYESEWLVLSVAEV